MAQPTSDQHSDTHTSTPASPPPIGPPPINLTATTGSTQAADSEPQPKEETDAHTEPSYKLKHVTIAGRGVPIVMQNENGPCPLLAIANVLLLRNQIRLPGGASDVAQGRLISLVAGHLLDSNSEERLGVDATKEYRTNLARNLADAIDLLPKLVTGVDVNVRFTDIDKFEFTDEVAIFDLLGIPLVHGWLIDPQDETVAALIGNSSYNELLAKLTTAEPEPTTSRDDASEGTQRATPRLSTQQATTTEPPAVARQALILDSSHGESTARAAPPSDVAPLLDARQGSFDANMQAAIALSIADSNVASTPVAPAQSAHEGSRAEEGSSSPAHEVENPAAESRTIDLQTQQGSVAAAAGASSAGEKYGAVEGTAVVAVADAGSTPVSIEANEPYSAIEPIPTTSASIISPSAAAPVENASLAYQSEAGEAAQTSQEEADAASVRKLVDSVFKAHLRPSPVQSEPSPGGITYWEAAVVTEFLNTSQLTYHGLMQLHEGMRTRQLAVFFRNNHFNCLFKHGDGRLYLLVTDQGYLRERNVVWERLSGIDGDSTFYKADFSPFSREKSEPQESAVSRWAPEAAYSSDPADVKGADSCSEVRTNHDADFALALQMQQEEDDQAEAARIAARRQQEQAATTGQSSSQSSTAQQAGRQAADARSGQAAAGTRPVSGRGRRTMGQVPAKDDKSSCNIQ